MNFKEGEEGGICEDWEKRKGRGNGVIISQSQKIKENVKKKTCIRTPLSQRMDLATHKQASEQSSFK